LKNNVFVYDRFIGCCMQHLTSLLILNWYGTNGENSPIVSIIVFIFEKQAEKRWRRGQTLRVSSSGPEPNVRSLPWCWGGHRFNLLIPSALGSMINMDGLPHLPSMDHGEVQRVFHKVSLRKQKGREGQKIAKIYVFHLMGIPLPMFTKQ